MPYRRHLTRGFWRPYVSCSHSNNLFICLLPSRFPEGEKRTLGYTSPYYPTTSTSPHHLILQHPPSDSSLAGVNTNKPTPTTTTSTTTRTLIPEMFSWIFIKAEASTQRGKVDWPLHLQEQHKVHCVLAVVGVLFFLYPPSASLWSWTCTLKKGSLGCLFSCLLSEVFSYVCIGTKPRVDELYCTHTCSALWALRSASAGWLCSLEQTILFKYCLCQKKSDGFLKF